MTMTIRREDIDAGRIDFSDIAGPERVPLTHPGTMLRVAQALGAKATLPKPFSTYTVLETVQRVLDSA